MQVKLPDGTESLDSTGWKVRGAQQVWWREGNEQNKQALQEKKLYMSLQYIIYIYTVYTSYVKLSKMV